MNNCKYCQNYGKSSPCVCVLGGERATSIWGKVYADIRLSGDADQFGEDKEQIVVATSATRNLCD